MSDSLAVELHQVTKVFPGGIKAVDNLSLDIPRGHIIALLGASGCGKTTTLRLINRLEDTTSGQILVRGQDIRRQRPETLRRSVGYVIQEGGLFPHFTVSRNVAVVPKLLGWPAQRTGQRVAEILELVGLPESKFGRRMPAELSGGQRQRVGVARALAADPDILLMDEPFGALDPGTREAIQDEFLRLHAQLRKAVILVTHDMAEAGKLAEHIVLMDHGQIIQQGTLGDLLLRPANDRVRAFLGRQRQALALELLRLVHVLPGLAEVAASENAIRLSGEMRLSQALAALVDAEVNAQVLVDVPVQRAYSALELRRRILAGVNSATRTEN
jgi:osmoprotectant transport system ATP-binding protein